MKYTDEQQRALAKWLHTHAFRLSRRPRRRRGPMEATQTQIDHAKARATMWAAARKLRAIEGEDPDAF